MSLGRYCRCQLTLLGWRFYGYRLAQRYRKLMDREYWSAEQWREYQDALLQRFVQHCYDHVPLHRERMDAAGVQPADIRSVADLPKIPVLTKQEVREAGKRMLATNVRENDLRTTHTTGSTGTPLTFYGDLYRGEHVMAGLWRIYSRCGWRPGEPIVTVWGFRARDYKRSRLNRWLRDTASGLIHFNAFQANDREFGNWLEVLRRRKPTVLVCYASSGSRFARWLLDQGETVAALKGVYCTSETLLEQQAELMKQAFGCPVFDLYGCGEVVHVAASCEQGRMHINPDMAVVETGEPTPDGRTPLILTGLRNWSMPFLRYHNGDCGALLSEQCACGRQSPLMELQITRLADVFRFANGKEYPSLYFILRLYTQGFDGVELFQFRQLRPDFIRLQIVRNERFSADTERRLREVKAEIETHIEQQAQVEVEYVDQIEQTSSGKHLYARSDVSPEQIEQLRR